MITYRITVVDRDQPENGQAYVCEGAFTELEAKHLSTEDLVQRYLVPASFAVVAQWRHYDFEKRAA